MTEGSQLDFAGLIVAIEQTHAVFATQVSKAVKDDPRNWLIGYYIAEYELKGADRAGYGRVGAARRTVGQDRPQRGGSRTAALPIVSEAAYRTFGEALSPVLAGLPGCSMCRCGDSGDSVSRNLRHITDRPRNARLWAERLSFCFAELLQIEPRLKRLFYEVEILRGNWSCVS